VARVLRVLRVRVRGAGWCLMPRARVCALVRMAHAARTCCQQRCLSCADASPFPHPPTHPHTPHTHTHTHHTHTPHTHTPHTHTHHTHTHTPHRRRAQLPNLEGDDYYGGTALYDFNSARGGLADQGRYLNDAAYSQQQQPGGGFMAPADQQQQPQQPQQY
jgi:hypothetical protein